jgi:parallel beta-helix repeat protein
MTPRPLALSAALAASVALAGARPGAAATLCVHPAGAGGCHSTIQAAVSAAGAGDLVRIARGVYYESVTVHSEQAGLRIVGAADGSSVLDSSAYADRGIADAGFSLGIASPNVRVQDLTFRNGLIGVSVGASGVVLERLRFRGTDNPVFLAAPEAQVLDNDLRACFGCIYLFGATDALVRGNLVRNALSGIDVNAHLFPDRPTVVGNRVEVAGIGINLSQLIRPTVRSNQVRYASTGLAAGGIDPVVEDNHVALGLSGLSVSCSGLNFEAGPGDDVPAQCGAASFSFNTSTDTHAGSGVGTEAPGLRVRGNVFTRSSGLQVFAGLDEDGRASGMVVEGNRVAGAGIVPAPGSFQRNECFNAFGDEILLLRNSATGCAAAGIFIEGRNGRIEGNETVGGAGSGIVLDGTVSPEEGTSTNSFNVVEGNRALGNAAQGIAILDGVAGTQVTGNTATGNRTDFCDEGMFTNASGNTFGTVGPCAVVD